MITREEFAGLVTDVLDAGRGLVNAHELGVGIGAAEGGAKKAHEAAMATYDAQAVRIAQLEAMLRKLEWSGTCAWSAQDYLCPVCGRDDLRSHKPDCALAKLLGGEG